MYLEKIDSPADVKRLSVGELTELSDEIREALLHKVSAHGGHFGPNLGMVEATVALHYVFDSPKDKLVFDVSHQSYVHKMLTGVAGRLSILRNTTPFRAIPSRRRAHTITSSSGIPPLRSAWRADWPRPVTCRAVRGMSWPLSATDR